jgi:diguanylate cyclase (GGDEF)-like protein
MNDVSSFDHAALGPLFDLLSDGIAIAAPNPWRLVYVSPTLAGWLKREAGTLRDVPIGELFTSDYRAQVVQLADSVFREAQTKSSMTVELQTESADVRVAVVSLCCIDQGAERLLGVVIRRQMSSQTADGIERCDPLTRIPDRAFLLVRLSTLLHSKRLADRQFAVLFIDLDNFKLVNDAHGHLVGDRVLCEVARRLVGSVRDGDHVVRYGGDEFVVLVERVADSRTIESIIGRIHAALAKPIALPQGEFTLSLSIGVCQASPDHQAPEDVLREADRAMYAAKRRLS